MNNKAIGVSAGLAVAALAVYFAGALPPGLNAGTAKGIVVAIVSGYLVGGAAYAWVELSAKTRALSERNDSPARS